MKIRKWGLMVWAVNDPIPASIGGLDGAGPWVKLSEDRTQFGACQDLVSEHNALVDLVEKLQRKNRDEVG